MFGLLLRGAGVSWGSRWLVGGRRASEGSRRGWLPVCTGGRRRGRASSLAEWRRTAPADTDSASPRRRPPLDLSVRTHSIKRTSARVERSSQHTRLRPHPSPSRSLLCTSRARATLSLSLALAPAAHRPVASPRTLVPPPCPTLRKSPSRRWSRLIWITRSGTSYVPLPLSSRSSSLTPCSAALSLRQWIDTHVSPPFKRPSHEALNAVQPRRGDTISFYKDVPEILHRIETKGSYMALCSRTSAPE
jgi:hypothetical protein